MLSTLRHSWSGTRLDVAGLEIEAKGLFGIVGEFSIEKHTIDGKSKIRAAPDVAESIPGAHEEVFTEPRGDYLWTTMTLSGQWQPSREDLKQRLVTVAKEHFAKGILSRIFTPGKQVLEMLNAIYK